MRRQSRNYMMIFLAVGFLGLLFYGYTKMFPFERPPLMNTVAATLSADKPERKQILVLNSYHADMPWVKMEEDGIRSVFEGDDRVSLYFDYMDTKRNIGSEYLDRFLALYEEKCKEKNFAAVIVTDDAAYQFALKHQQELFPGIPIVFCGVNFLSPQELNGNSLVTGVVEVTDIKQTLETALRLHPEVKRIAFINDRSEVGKVNRRLLDEVMPEFSGRVEFSLFDDLTMQELLTKVAGLGKDSLILLMTFNVDRQQQIFSYEDSADLIAASSQVPIYCTWSFYLGHGVVGGMMTSGYTQGKTAAELTRQILFEGSSPANMPVVTKSVNEYIFDYPELKKAGIKEDLLPAGSRVINKPVTFYETYKGLVWSVAGIIFLLAAWVAVLARNIRYRKQSEEKIRQLNAELESRVLIRTRDLQETNEKLTAAMVDLTQTRGHLVEAEKMASLGELVAGIAHEINTPVGNSITAVSHLETSTLEVEAKFSAGSMKKSDLDNYFDVSRNVVKIILSNLQRAAELIRSFKKVAVDQSVEERRRFNLSEYMKDVLISLKPQMKKTAHKIVFHCPEQLEVYWDPGALWQIISNLLSNSLLHAYEEGTAGTITIDIEQTEKEVVISYADDGKGMSSEVKKKLFEPFFTTRRGSGGSGLGMHIVYNLVVFKMNGSIECNSELGAGTKFVIRISSSVSDKG